MTRLKKELMKREIIFDHDGCGEVYYHQYRPEYDDCQHLVGVTDQFIICVYYSEVLDSELRLYDRHTFKLIAGQLLHPDKCMSFGKYFNKWMPSFYEDEYPVDNTIYSE